MSFGNTPPYHITVGQLAEATGVAPRLLEWWLNRGFVRTDHQLGNGSGSRRMIPSSEIAVVTAALKLITALGVKASDKLFEEARRNAQA